MADGETRNGPILLLIGAVVIAAGIAGYFLIGGNDSPVTPSEAEIKKPKRPNEWISPETRKQRVRDAGATPEQGPEGPPAPAPVPSIANLPVIAKRADGRQIPAELTSQFSTQVTSAIRECAKSIPTENRAGSRMTGKLTLGITSGSARIVSTDVALTDVPDGAGKTAALDCLRKNIVGLTQPTTEADVADYEIAVSMLLFPGATGAAKNAAAQAGSGSAQPK